MIVVQSFCEERALKCPLVFQTKYKQAGRPCGDLQHAATMGVSVAEYISQQDELSNDGSIKILKVPSGRGRWRIGFGAIAIF